MLINLWKELTVSTYFFIIVTGCSDAQNDLEPRQIRGHFQNFQGVAHADGSIAPYRNCGYCHGKSLLGGEENAIPSCFKCHGEYWEQGDYSNIRAPNSHQENYDGFLHHKTAFQPQENCASCHPIESGGNAQAALPNCITCHERKW